MATITAEKVHIMTPLAQGRLARRQCYSHMVTMPPGAGGTVLRIKRATQ